MRRRILLTNANGCDAIGPDDMDVYSNENSGGAQPLVSERYAIHHHRKMSRYAHRLGMSPDLKNSLEILPPSLKILNSQSTKSVCRPIHGENMPPSRVCAADGVRPFPCGIRQLYRREDK
ncbi:glycoside hydrolase family 114 protein [Zopfia rhizophila CBS 207.26]|uniref:Glycoside hydrolase family 114 protein n=1 Tax=Zopfia rhizophila CBS 207.26 TaxID=1314779 RepID=A0A6A6DJ68_9PEZI|nr:glycoside hydrolase family 114 protein [Zopfia rhizophila CBS 207.26]